MVKERSLARIIRRGCRRSGKHKKGSTRSTWHGKRKCGDILTVAFDTFSDRHHLCRVIKRDSLRQLPPIPASASIYMTTLPIISVNDELSYLLQADFIIFIEAGLRQAVQIKTPRPTSFPDDLRIKGQMISHFVCSSREMCPGYPSTTMVLRYMKASAQTPRSRPGWCQITDRQACRGRAPRTNVGSSASAVVRSNHFSRK